MLLVLLLLHLIVLVVGTLLILAVSYCKKNAAVILLPAAPTYMGRNITQYMAHNNPIMLNFSVPNFHSISLFISSLFYYLFFSLGQN